MSQSSLDVQYWKREPLEKLKEFSAELDLSAHTAQFESKAELLQQVILPYVEKIIEKYPNIITESQDMCIEQYRKWCEKNSIDDKSQQQSPKSMRINHLFCTCHTQKIQKKLLNLHKFQTALLDIAAWNEHVLLKDIKLLVKEMSSLGMNTLKYSKKTKLELIEDLIDFISNTLLPDYMQRNDNNEWWETFSQHIAHYADDNPYLFFTTLPDLFHHCPPHHTTTTHSNHITNPTNTNSFPSPSTSQVLSVLQHPKLHQEYEGIRAYRHGYDLYSQAELPPTSTITGMMLVQQEWEIDHIVEQQVLATAIATAARSTIYCPSTSAHSRCLWQRVTENNSFMQPLKEIVHDMTNLTITTSTLNASKGQVCKEFLQSYRTVYPILPTNTTTSTTSHQLSHQRLGYVPKLHELFYSSTYTGRERMIGQYTNQVIRTLYEVMPRMIEDVYSLQPIDRYVSRSMFGQVGDSLEHLMELMGIEEYVSQDGMTLRNHVRWK